MRASPSRAISCGSRPAIFCAAETDLALAAVDAAHAIEHAGLAGAVRADQRKQFARFDRERDAVEHGQAAEAQRQAIDLELSHTISGCGDIA